MTDSSLQVTASISAQNTGTDWLTGPGTADLSLSSSSFSGTTVHLQRKLRGEAASAAVDVESYTAATEKVIEDASGQFDYRLFVKTGNYGGAAITAKLIRG